MMEVSEKRLIVVNASVYRKTSLQITIKTQSESTTSDVVLSPTKPSILPIYKYYSYPHEYGFREIEIKIIEGSISIHEDAALAFYPGFSRGGFAEKCNVQNDYIQWFYSNTHNLGIEYSAPSTMRFKHLILCGPSFMDKNNDTHYTYCPLHNFKGLERDQLTEKLSRFPV